MSDLTAATLAAFQSKGAYLTGHFRLTSGLHSPNYLQCAKVLQYPEYAERFAGQLRELLAELAVDVVCSPAMGGLIIGHEAAREFGTRFVFTERDGDGKMTLRRGFEIAAGERVLVVEDVITTGGSTREVIALLQGMAANVVGAASIVDRSGGEADVGVPRVALATLTVTAYEPGPETCPLCAQGVELVKPGSRPTQT
jgi:orotate phosphoribosyltransferase